MNIMLETAIALFASTDILFLVNWVLLGIFISILSNPTTRKPVYYEQINMKPVFTWRFFYVIFYECVCVRVCLSLYYSCACVCVCARVY